MAHTKAQKAAKGNKDSVSKRLGVKLYGGQTAKNGNIIIRQRGETVKAGVGTRVGHDYTIYAIRDGVVQFLKKQGRKVVAVNSPTS
jgi:large subunit ribosomal protein L27